MERTGSSDLQQLIAERGRVKAALTRLKTFYDTRGETEPIASLRLRLDQNLALLQQYEAIHDRIIAAVASSAEVEAHERGKDEFEDMYYRLLGAIQIRIESSQDSKTSNNTRCIQVTSASPVTSETPPSTRLLAIAVPQFHDSLGE